MEYYSSIKRYEVLIQLQHENIVLREISQIQKKQ